MACGCNSRREYQRLRGMIELGFLIALQAVIGGFDSHILHQKQYCVRLRVRSIAFQAMQTGSSPVRSTRLPQDIVQQNIHRLLIDQPSFPLGLLATRRLLLTAR